MTTTSSRPWRSRSWVAGAALAVLVGGLGTAAPARAADFTFTMDFSATAQLNRATGGAFISGTITCSRDASAALSGTMLQARTRTSLAQGFWSLPPVPCGPAPTTWTAEVFSTNSVAFGPGKAEVRSDSFAFDPSTGSATGTGPIRATVTLKN